MMLEIIAVCFLSIVLIAVSLLSNFRIKKLEDELEVLKKKLYDAGIL